MSCHSASFGDTSTWILRRPITWRLLLARATALRHSTRLDKPRDNSNRGTFLSNSPEFRGGEEPKLRCDSSGSPHRNALEFWDSPRQITWAQCAKSTVWSVFFTLNSCGQATEHPLAGYHTQVSISFRPLIDAKSDHVCKSSRTFQSQMSRLDVKTSTKMCLRSCRAVHLQYMGQKFMKCWQWVCCSDALWPQASKICFIK